MKLSEFSVKNSLLINLISVLILILGFYTVFIEKIRREAFPEVSYDSVIVTTVYPGASPEEIEKLVTVPLEKEIKAVDGLERFQSKSLENTSTIMVEISQDVKDKSKVIDDIGNAVDRVTDLPQDAEEPFVLEITSGEIPVVQVALSGNLDEFKLQDLAEDLEDILENIEGVSSISRRGWRDKQVNIAVDPKKMQDYRVSFTEIISALSKKNVSIPGGKLRSDLEFNIRTTGEFTGLEEISNVIIRANDFGNWLKVKDVASVEYAFEDETVLTKSQGTRSIILTVLKRPSADAISLVNRVKASAERFQARSEASLKIAYIDDISFYIKRRLGVLKNNGIIGLALVCIVLMLFLDKRVAVLAALGIPIAFSATIALMGFYDISVNLISMFGLIIVLGMLVDDGIIVAENCSRYIEDGYSPKEAAVRGTNEVIKPVTTTILTTIAAFLPLIFMIEGIMGKFIRLIPIVVIIALLASLFEAVVILPSHFADFVKIPKIGKLSSKKETKWFQKLLSRYTVVVRFCLEKRYLVGLSLILLLAVTVKVASGMSFILFGSQEIEQFYIRAEVPVGTNLYNTSKAMEAIEAKVAKLSDNELDAYITDVGSIGNAWQFDPYGKSGSSNAQLTVYVKPEPSRKRKVEAIIDSLRDQIKELPGFDKIYFEKEHGGPPIGKAVSARVRGEDFKVLEEISQRIISFLSAIDGVTDIVSSFDSGGGEIRVVIDEEESTRSGLSVSDIGIAVRAAFKGAIATTIKPTKATEEIDVVVILPAEKRNNPLSFNDIIIENKFGQLIPLTSVARIEERKALTEILHLDGKRVVTVNADVDTEKTTSLEINRMLAKEFSAIEDDFLGYSIDYGGEQEENVKAARGFLKSFALGFFLIFMILAACFGSLIQPFVVMLAIPFGVIGVIWAFYFHQLPMSFFMMMGLVGLSGIVVNDSIVLVEFINNARRKGINRRESIIEAGRLRLRPVLLTTITTALGLTPTAYGIWGGDPFLRPMALTIVWGILCATVLTLLVLPCIYAIIDDITLKISGHFRRKKNKPKEIK